MKKCFLLVAGICAAAFHVHAQQTGTRIEKKSFTDISEIRFDHSFGNITVVESESQQVELEIQYFDGEDIKPECEISETDKILTIKTVYPDRHRNTIYRYRRRNDGNDRTKIAVDYIIAVPKNVAMKVAQKYGNITAGDFYGEFACDLAYANLNVNKLFRSPVRISGRYANIRIDRVEVLNLSANYSRINISELDELYAKLKYTPASVGSVGKKLTVDAAYSSIKVGNTSRQLESAKFNCSYSNMDLRFDPDLSADLNINLKYGNLSVSSKYSVKYSLSETSYNKVIRKGTLGSSTPAASIAISSSYANVSIR